MKKLVISLVILIVAFLSLYFYLMQDFDHSTPTIYKNANIITLNDKQPIAQAMLVENGVIRAIGSNKEILNLKTNKLTIIDMGGKTILPGFIDVHTHVALSSFLADMIDLSGFKHKTNKEVWSYLEKSIPSKKPGEWILCKGIDPIFVKDLKTPTLAYMDSIAPNNPMIMLSQSLHSYWANTKAFERTGITNKTPAPSTSSFYEKDQNGNLTGFIVEQKAFTPFIKQIKKDILSSKKLTELTIKVLKDYARNGNTAVVSAGITINNAKPLRLYRHLSAAKPSLLNQLLTAFGLLPTREPYPRHFIYIRFDRTFLLPKKEENGDNGYKIIGVKQWADGSPYAGTMFLSQPYLDSELSRNILHISAGHTGKELINEKDLTHFIVKYQKKGWQIAIHAQGDAAIDEVLKAYDAADKEVDVTKTRNRIEHCLMLTEPQIEKMKELGMTPSFHINHLYYYGEALESSIIGNRAHHILPIATAIKKGLVVSLHADQPMFKSKPFRLIQTAVERKTIEGDTLGYPQHISLIEGLKAMTINAAWQIHMEDKIGSLEKGKLADFIIVDRDPFQIPISQLEEIQVLKTFVSGNEIILQK
jgi:predicted amidohydrolase YtcJ